MPSVVLSERVTELIKKLPPEKVKQASFLKVKDSQLAFSSFKETLKEGLLSRDITISSEFGYVFEGLESDVIERLEIIERSKRKTPVSILTKMILTRLVKIHKASPGLTRKSLDGDSLAAATLVNWTSSYHTKKCRKAAGELMKILDRDDVTVEVLNDAWDQFMIWKIMDS